eukprot:8095419-Prorocentrum_lima.AAC.1
MTSSLVGSEMCIRDRAHMLRPTAVMARSLTTASAPFANLEGTSVLEGASAVSYTHLTLPTICSV